MASKKAGSTSASKTKNTTKNNGANSKAKQTVARERNSRIIHDEEKDLSPERIREIYLLIYLAIAIFLMCANFGICGMAGNAISSLFFGFFGRIQYVMPLYFFLATAFILANGPKKSVIRKIVWIGVAFIISASIFQLLSGVDIKSFKELFNLGYEKRAGGGILAGGLTILLIKLISKVGVIILLVVLSFVTIIEVTGISLIKFIKDLAGDMNPVNLNYDDIKEGDVVETHPAMKKRGLLDRIAVMEDSSNKAEENKGGSKSKKSRKNVVVADEEVHELLDGDISHDTLPDPFHDRKTDIISELRAQAFKEGVNKVDEDTKKEAEEVLKASDFKPEAEERHISLPNSMTIQNLKYNEVSNESKISIPDFIKKSNQEREASDDTFNSYDSEEFELEPSSETYNDPLYEDSDIRYDEKTGTVSKEMDELFNDSGSDANIDTSRDINIDISRDTNIDISRDTNIDTDTSGDIKNDTTKVTKADKEKETASVASEIGSAENSNNKVKAYRFPPTSLLKKMKNSSSDSMKDVRETQIRLAETLKSFGVNVTMTGVSQGPAVTRYEMQPDVGVKVSKILSLQDDIKLALAATDIRIEAPIPGKSAIGIEVPNKVNAAVSARELIESSDFKESGSKISFAVGKDIGGKTVVGNLAKMPHLLIAGQTGSGKSVCINTIIMSILFKARPDEVRMIMIDPKQVELAPYNGIPHLLIPVVTDPKKAAGALNWAVIEMTKRYQLFAKYNVRNIEGYNKKLEDSPEEFLTEGQTEAPKKMPLIVVIVDELADLMMVAHGEVEDSIVRLSQLARAAGIHLIIATQRPSVDVITGLIKANVPSRIAFSVSSGVDSRTIIDMVGAEKLLGHGDMLYFPTGYSKPVRVQGAFISDEEINSVTDFIKSNFEGGGYDSNIAEAVENSSSNAAQSLDSDDDNRYDELFEDAAKLVIEKDKASIGNLQRVFRIGFNRAARIMDQLCEAGVVGEEEGTKPRRVLMTATEFDEKFSVK